MQLYKFKYFTYPQIKYMNVTKFLTKLTTHIITKFKKLRLIKYTACPMDFGISKM